MTVERALQESFLFGNFPPEEIRRLAQICTARKVRAGEIIFHEGDSGDTLFLVDKGCVRIYRVLSERYDETLVILEAGGVFGEMSFIDRVERSSSAMAMSASYVVEMGRSDFDVILSKQPASGARVLRQIAEIMAMRVRSTDERLSEAVQWIQEIRRWSDWSVGRLPSQGTKVEVVIRGVGTIEGKVVDIVQNPIGHAYLVEDEDGKIHWAAEHALYYVRVRP